MSADNFYGVSYRPDLNPDKPWCVGMGFMSEYVDVEGDWTPERDSNRPVWFATLAEACEYANQEYSEYGLLYMFRWGILPSPEDK